MYKRIWKSLITITIMALTLSFQGFITDIYADKAMTEEQISQLTRKVCADTDISPQLVEAIIWRESRYCPDVHNGNHYGLMQISSWHHRERIARLGVTNLYDPEQNVRVGVDLLKELSTQYEPDLALMVYNYGPAKAKYLYNQGRVSSYAKQVLEKAAEFEKRDEVKEWEEKHQAAIQKLIENYDLDRLEPRKVENNSLKPSPLIWQNSNYVMELQAPKSLAGTLNWRPPLRSLNDKN